MKTEMKPLRTFAATVKSFKSHARQEPCRITNLLFILSLFLSLSILFLFKSHYCSSPFGLSLSLFLSLIIYIYVYSFISLKF